MNKLIFGIFLSLFIFNLHAQERGKVRVGVDAGMGLVLKGGGFTGGLDVRYNILDNLNAGVKFGLGMLLKDNYITSGLASNLLLSGDYYFGNGYSSFAPFIGGGTGLFSNQNIYGDEESQNNIVWKDVPVVKSLGGVVRAGFELGKIRISAEYYIIPPSSLYDISLAPTDRISNNSFINLSAGIYFGGGKWRKGNY